MIRRAAARGILGAGFLVLATQIGTTLRGPHAGGGVVRDAAAGLTFLGGACALRWAVGELGHDDELQAVAELARAAR